MNKAIEAGVTIHQLFDTMLNHIFDCEDMLIRANQSVFVDYSDSEEEEYKVLGYLLANYRCWFDIILKQEENMATAKKTTKKSTKKGK